MCVVSMVGDHYRDTFPTQPYWPAIQPHIPFPYAPLPTTITIGVAGLLPEISRAEFDELKRDVVAMKELLRRAKAYDEANGEPNCEIDEKMELLRKIAGLVGVDLDDVLKAKGK